MELNTDNILNVLVSPGTYVNEPECVTYISTLGDIGLEKLSYEPDRLKEENKHLLQQKQDLAFSNYKTFIETAECSREISQKFFKTESNLDSIIDELPKLNEMSRQLSLVGSQVDSSRKLNSLVLSKHNDLLRLLELPQLMENWIRNRKFEEALELSSYVKWLGKKHGNIGIIKSIVSDFEKSWEAMLLQLIAQLRYDLQLPECLEVVGYIRRMEVFSDAELRLKFLQTRDIWFQSLLNSVPKSDGYQCILKVIELTRMHLFKIITQYRAIFSDEESVLPSSKAYSVNETTIFYSWLNEKISQFISTLDDPEIVKNISSLDSIMVESMNFGQSFSRIGADFRALLACKFIRIIEQNFEYGIRKTNKRFETDMQKFVISKCSTKEKSTNQNYEIKPEQPPNCLAQFHPLANYTNGVLTAFNELRECAPLSIADFVSNTMQESLKHCSRIILQFCRQEQAFDSAAKEKFLQFCGCFRILVVYIQECLHVIFPLEAIAHHLGIPVHQLQKEGLTSLQDSAILDQLNHLMPEMETVPEKSFDTLNHY